MINLNDIKKIRRLDKSNILASIEKLEEQIEETYFALKNLKLPSSYSKINKIVVNGMGGSRLGARVAQRLLETELKVPIIPIGSYHLPNFVDKNTLLILSSYSGTTEEILYTTNDALKRKSKLLILSQGGPLALFAKKHNLPGYYNFSDNANPSKQPRMSIGTQIFAILMFLAKCGLYNIPFNQIKELKNFLKKERIKYSLNISEKKNIAKKLAYLLKNKIAVFVAAEFLTGALHVLQNQTHENSKQFVLYHEIPELNHHLLEGLKYPSSNKKNLYFIFFFSNFYFSRNQKRLKITEKVLDGYKIKYKQIKLKGKNKLIQVFEVIQLGAYIAFYLSMLNNLDPSLIPWVDFFKKEMKK